MLTHSLDICLVAGILCRFLNKALVLIYRPVCPFYVGHNGVVPLHKLPFFLGCAELGELLAHLRQRILELVKEGFLFLRRQAFVFGNHVEDRFVLKEGSPRGSLVAARQFLRDRTEQLFVVKIRVCFGVVFCRNCFRAGIVKLNALSVLVFFCGIVQLAFQAVPLAGVGNLKRVSDLVDEGLIRDDSFAFAVHRVKGNVYRAVVSQHYAVVARKGVVNDDIDRTL